MGDISPLLSLNSPNFTACTHHAVAAGACSSKSCTLPGKACCTSSALLLKAKHQQSPCCKSDSCEQLHLSCFSTSAAHLDAMQPEHKFLDVPCRDGPRLRQHTQVSS